MFLVVGDGLRGRNVKPYSDVSEIASMGVEDSQRVPLATPGPGNPYKIVTCLF